jgi:hypothetical protein
MDDQRKAPEPKERDEKEDPTQNAVPPEQAVPPAFEPGRQQDEGDGDGEASDDLQNDPAYEPKDQGLKGIKGG